MKGIASTTYRRWCETRGLPLPDTGGLHHIPDQQWNAILKILYRDRRQADRALLQPVANILVDRVWCSGVRGVKILRRLVGVFGDGLALTSVNACDPAQFFGEVKTARLAYVENIAACNNADTQRATTRILSVQQHGYLACNNTDTRCIKIFTCGYSYKLKKN